MMKNKLQTDYVVKLNGKEFLIERITPEAFWTKRREEKRIFQK